MLRDAWERFLLYLPLVFMGMLALVTYWLVRSAPASSDPVMQRIESHAPDYFMEGFSVRTFDVAGRVRSEVWGDKARHYPDTKSVEIDAIRIRSFDEQGRLTTATANRGVTNEDVSEVQLMGNAVIVREPQSVQGTATTQRMEYRSDFLHAFMKTERVQSNKPVALTRGSDHFTADSLNFDNLQHTLQLQGRVRGTLVPLALPAR